MTLKMSLIDRLRTGKDKSLFVSDTQYVMYSTGFEPLDYINAFYVDYIDSKGNRCTDIAKGVMGGRFITIVGSSGTGKSTLADQIAWNIIKPFIPQGAFMMHVDVEQTVVPQRIYDILGLDASDPAIESVIINKESTYIEDVLKIVDDICKDKQEHPEEMYEADGKWFGKKKIKVYVPTVIIIDSLPSFVSKDSNTSSIDGQMTTNREVAMVAQFYTKLLSKISKYNITIIATNHIRPKIVVDPYNQPPPQLMLLKASETLPRGQAPIFYATSVFRLNVSGKSAIYNKEEHGFTGFRTIAQATKSKTSFIGGNCSLVFTGDHGYDSTYSLLEFAYDHGMVDGRDNKDPARSTLHLKTCPDVRFSKRDFGYKYNNDPEFKKAIDAALLPEFKSFMIMNEEHNRDTDNIDSKKFFSEDSNGNMVADKLVETNEDVEIHKSV